LLRKVNLQTTLSGDFPSWCTSKSSCLHSHLFSAIRSQIFSSPLNQTQRLSISRSSKFTITAVEPSSTFLIQTLLSLCVSRYKLQPWLCLVLGSLDCFSRESAANTLMGTHSDPRVGMKIIWS
jgi:hypothetical protein